LLSLQDSFLLGFNKWIVVIETLLEKMF
jgi:hypothetical protein